LAEELSTFVDESGDRGGKAMLAYFSSFVRRLPISYITLVYRRSQFEDLARLMERMGRDISSAMVEHLDFFQSFDDVKVYYDNGQDIVKQALDRSVGKVLSKGVVRRRKTSMTDYRLEQAADYLCTIELALVKYQAKEDSKTHNKFFGGIGSFSSSKPAASGYRWFRGSVRNGQLSSSQEPQAACFDKQKPKRKQWHRGHRSPTSLRIQQWARIRLGRAHYLAFDYSIKPVFYSHSMAQFVYPLVIGAI
jgi:hypothetical protein